MNRVRKACLLTLLGLLPGACTVETGDVGAPVPLPEDAKAVASSAPPRAAQPSLDTLADVLGDPQDDPSDAQLDAVLYHRGREYEKANEPAMARKAYFELIVKRPDSRFVPRAYLAFGELFFAEAGQDPSKWELAEQAYQKVVSYPPEKNDVYDYAWYKLGLVFWNSGDLDRARAAFQKTIDYGAAYPEHPGAAQLAKSARKSLASIDALTRPPDAPSNASR
jgi:tetratricopeptide (TPR) repeat protein